MSDHEEWESRIQRGTFNPTDWARDLKRDLATYRLAEGAVRNEVEDNEGDDPMTDEYKRLEMVRAHAASNVHRHLNHGVLSAIADLILSQQPTN